MAQVGSTKFHLLLTHETSFGILRGSWTRQSTAFVKLLLPPNATLAPRNHLLPLLKAGLPECSERRLVESSSQFQQ